MMRLISSVSWSALDPSQLLRPLAVDLRQARALETRTFAPAEIVRLFPLPHPSLQGGWSGELPDPEPSASCTPPKGTP
jgi:hypothetical protein